MTQVRTDMYSLAGSLRKEYQKRTNNMYIWAELARKGLEQSLQTMQDEDATVSTEDPAFFLRSQIPARNGREKYVQRSRPDVISLLQSARRKDFNYALLTYLVAQTEAFLADLVSGILKIDSRRLKIRVKGINHQRKIDADAIIDATSLNDVINELISSEIISVFYASPQKQQEYISKVAGIQIGDELETLFLKWFEYKAARDVIVHNGGRINDIYMNKSGELARGALNSLLEVDDVYLLGSFVDVKSLMGHICSGIQRANEE